MTKDEWISALAGDADEYRVWHRGKYHYLAGEGLFAGVKRYRNYPCGGCLREMRHGTKCKFPIHIWPIGPDMLIQYMT